MQRPSDKHPYAVIKIRLKGNNKTVDEDTSHKPLGRRNVTKKGNAVDPVRGCPSYANYEYPQCSWDCYSEESVRRFKKDFGVPVIMQLDEALLRKDLQECDADWVRIGIDGAPFANDKARAVTVRVAEIIAEEGKIPVLITRFWTVPTSDEYKRLLNAGTIIHGTTSVTDPIQRRERTDHALRIYQMMGGDAVKRVVTYFFHDSDKRWDTQDMMMEYTGIPILEQPARLQRTTPKTVRKNSMWGEVCQIKYHPYHSYVSGKPNPRWRTAGALYKGQIHVRACEDDCISCPNQCMVRYIRGRGHVLGESNLAEVVT